MKKYLDRYLFSRLGLQLLFSAGAIVLFAMEGTMVRNWATGEVYPSLPGGAGGRNWATGLGQTC